MTLNFETKSLMLGNPNSGLNRDSFELQDVAQEFA